ncbi:MAG: hypothetical protein H6Q53_1682 [Deltaproteobacteria bacterium]|nr:hypothetical protein [Deltaproteobacteria bacterium]
MNRKKREQYFKLAIALHVMAFLVIGFLSGIARAQEITPPFDGDLKYPFTKVEAQELWTLEIWVPGLSLFWRAEKWEHQKTCWNRSLSCKGNRYTDQGDTGWEGN